MANYLEAYQLFCCTGILINHESPLRHVRFITRRIASTAARIKKVSREELEFGWIDIHRYCGWAPEYVEAMWLMLQMDAPDDYVIATGVSASLQVYVARVFEYLGLNWREFVTLNPVLKRPSNIDTSFGDAAKASEILGGKPTVRLPEIVSQMVEQEHGFLNAR